MFVIFYYSTKMLFFQYFYPIQMNPGEYINVELKKDVIMYF